MMLAIITVMTLEENIQKLEEERQRVVTVVRFCFWTPNVKHVLKLKTRRQP